MNERWETNVESSASGQLGRGGHRYAKADEELTSYFTSSLGVRAQQYEGCGGAFDSNETHTSRLKAMQWLSAPSSPMARHDVVAATLGQLPVESRRVLVLVYAPHAWPSTWLASALASPWGGGSMAALALDLPRATQEAERGNSVRRWLLDVDRPLEQERRRREVVCARLVRDAEALRMASLAMYEDLRAQRVSAEIAARRAAKAAREKANAERLAEELGMDRRIARARFERKLLRKTTAKATAAVT